MFIKTKIKYLNPITFTKKIISIIQHPKSKIILSILKFFKFDAIKSNNILYKKYFYAIYDLEYYPNTFNFVEFLVLCNIESKKRDNKRYIILFIPRKLNSLNNNIEYYKIIDHSSYKWRLYNLLIPLTYCSNLCINFNLFHDRQDAYNFIKDKEVFPNGYTSNLHMPLKISSLYSSNETIYLGGISSPQHSLILVNNWIKSKNITKKIVTISIRDQKFDKVRNSNIKEWVKFSSYLYENNFLPIVIPDTESDLDLPTLFNNCYISYESAFNVLFRSALNEIAYVNLFVSHGPLSLCAFNNNTNYIIMHYGPKKGSMTDHIKAYKDANDFKKGNYAFSKENQIRSWEEDTFDNILKEFKSLNIN